MEQQLIRWNSYLDFQTGHPTRHLALQRERQHLLGTSSQMEQLIMFSQLGICDRPPNSYLALHERQHLAGNI
jgi:hypothetical protein